MKNSLIRVLISLFLCCCLVLNVVSLPARASAAGALGIIKASTVTCNPYIITGAAIIALGIYAGVDSGAFETVANNCVDALEAAGTWVKDGFVELLRTEDEDGNASYYVDSGMMEDMRLWLDDNVLTYYTGSFSSGPYAGSIITQDFLDWISECSTHRYSYIAYSVQTWYAGFSDSAPFEFVPNGSYYSVRLVGGGYFSSKSLGISGKMQGLHNEGIGGLTHVNIALPQLPIFDVSMGVFPSVSVDGTSARQWSEDYSDRGLKVYGGGSGNNNNNGKWFWPVVLVAGADLLAMSQADAWLGETPQEFDDYTTVEELEIVSRPEVEFGQGLELAPVTSPSPDPGTGTNPDTGTDTDPDTGTNTGTNFLESLTQFFTPSGDITMYSLDLKELFPFCIPFDIYNFLAALSADPVAPVFEFDLNLGVATEPMKIDLSNWSDLAAIIRTLELGLFCLGLALKTRELIGG